MLHRYMHGVYRPQERTLCDNFKLSNGLVVTDLSGLYEYSGLRDQLAEQSRVLIVCYNPQSAQSLTHAKYLLRRYAHKERLLCATRCHHGAEPAGQIIAEELGGSHCSVDAESGHAIAVPFTWAYNALK